MKNVDAKEQQRKRLIKTGMIAVDDNGQQTLTEKGRQKVAHRIGLLPAGEEFLIELAVLDGHGIAVYAH